jgi:hypothetical protein
MKIKKESKDFFFALYVEEHTKIFASMNNML